MARNNAITNSFIAGESTLLFAGRTDTQQYNQACEELENRIVYPQGGSARRCGTIHNRVISQVNEDDSTSYAQKAAMIPFRGVDGTRWQIVINDLIPDPFVSPGLPYNGRAASSWFAINTVTGDRYDIGFSVTEFTDIVTKLISDDVDLTEVQFGQTGDVLILVHPKIHPIKIQYYGVGTSGLLGPFLGERWGVVPAPHASGYGATSPLPADRWKMIPFRPVVKSAAKTFTIAAVSGDQYTITSSGTDAEVFDSSYIGTYYKFSKGNQTAVLYIHTIDSTSQVTATLQVSTGLAAYPAVIDGVGDESFERAAWNVKDGFPRAIGFFEGRVVFGGSPTYGDTLWFSQTNDIFELATRKLEQDPTFADPVANTDSFETPLRDGLGTTIQWISAGKTLTVGTDVREYVVNGPNPQLSIGPLNINTQVETPNGSAYTMAVRLSNTTNFLQKDRRTIRELLYNLDEDSFKSPSLSTLAEHMANRNTLKNKYIDTFMPQPGYFKKMRVQQTQFPILWCLTNQGKLCGMTREKDQEVIAWHGHSIAGESIFDDGSDDGLPFLAKIEDISVVSRPMVVSNFTTGIDPGEVDELWMVVCRDMQLDESEENYVKQLHIEKMSLEWDRTSIGNDWVDTFPYALPVYMDCTQVTNSSEFPTGVITGLVQGNGQKVMAILNGIYIGEYTIDAGSIDISEKIVGLASWKVIIGINYMADLIPVVPEVQATLGTSLGSPRKVHELIIHFVRTIGARFGRITDKSQKNTPPWASSEEITFKPGENQDDPIPMYSGDKKVTFPGSYETRPLVLIRSHLPFPHLVTHVISKGVVSE